MMISGKRRLPPLLIGWGFIAAALIGQSAAAATGDADKGAVLASSCSGCHAIVGYRNAYPSYRVPKLGGQHAEYLYLGLQGYKSQGRAHLTMQAQAATLSDQDIRDLAAYFASQGGLEQGSAASDAKIALGKEKAAVCAACHGETGVSPAENWPSLAGQHQDYLQVVIEQYKTGQRNDPVMAGQVVNLSKQDVEDISAFYAAQPGLFTTE
jgi:cytochrome c553